ncbi:hypothetical protein MES5069_110089 [Mesorhizobium escarrei]|uniref:Uncharacterized protein n=1 Tax=Mesorhizobium escarrei TaxID=666018 RepID=A0ABN8JCH2_9HYPH|nr:hypothetical protein MES5069_110089 [Mesorhizobium escarrei]
MLQFHREPRVRGDARGLRECVAISPEVSGAATYDADVKDSTERSEHDRHHFRFINFPEDGVPEHTGKASLNDQTRVAKSNRL